MYILIADDDFVARKILSKALAPLGEIDVACNGTEALEAVAEAHRDGSPYKLILLDILMPGMDGREVLKQIRALEHAAGIHGKDRARIAMATMLGDSEHVIGSFHDECDGYIRKPYSRASLLEDLRNYGLP